MISIVACCHSVKLCVLAIKALQSQQNGAMTRMWRPCQVQPSQKEPAISAVHCKKERMLLQPLGRCSFECMIHRYTMNGMCTKNSTHLYQRWPWTRNDGVDSGKTHHFLDPDPEPESKIYEKPDSESLFIFDNSRSLHGLNKCHCLSLDTAEFQLHQWLPKFEQQSDSQIWKHFGLDLDSKILEEEWSQSMKMWFRPPLTPMIHM